MDRCSLKRQLSATPKSPGRAYEAASFPLSKQGRFNHRDFLPAQISRLSSLTQQLLASALSQCKLTIPQWRILVCLAERGASTLNDIVVFTRLPQSTLSRAVARLEEHGTVVSCPNVQDRRKVDVRLTDSGHELFLAARTIVIERCEAAIPISGDELIALKATLRSLIDVLSDEAKA